LDTQSNKREKQLVEFWTQWFKHLGQYLIPHDAQTMPNLRQLRESGRRIMLWSSHNNLGYKLSENPEIHELFQKYVWSTDERTFSRGGCWIEKEWQSGDYNRLEKAIVAEHFNEHSLARNHFWQAQLQLTPNFGSKDFLTTDATKRFFSPQVLAKDGNPQVALLLQKEEWKDHMSIVSVDFPTTDVIYEVVDANRHQVRVREAIQKGEPVPADPPLEVAFQQAAQI